MNGEKKARKDPIREISDPRNIRRTIKETGNRYSTAVKRAEEEIGKHKEEIGGIVAIGITCAAGAVNDFVCDTNLSNPSNDRSFSIKDASRKTRPEIIDSGTTINGIHIDKKSV